MLMAAALVISASMFASTGHKTSGKKPVKKSVATAQVAKEKQMPEKPKAAAKSSHKSRKATVAKEKAPKSETK